MERVQWFIWGCCFVRLFVRTFVICFLTVCAVWCSGAVQRLFWLQICSTPLRAIRILQQTNKQCSYIQFGFLISVFFLLFKSMYAVVYFISTNDNITQDVVFFFSPCSRQHRLKSVNVLFQTYQKDASASLLFSKTNTLEFRIVRTTMAEL